MTTARALTVQLAALLRRERHAMADFLVVLADFDRRRAWLELGHASLFSFLRRELGLSAGAAQYRKTAAELVRRHPEVESALREGKLCLSSVIELSKVLTGENVAEVLPRFFGLSSREAAAVAVSLRPVEHAPVREMVMPIRPAAVQVAAAAPAPLLAFAPQLQPTVDAHHESVRAPEAATTAPATPSRPASEPAPAVRAPALRPSVEPLDADRARLHLTVSRRLLAKLEAARSALSHVRPGASSEEVLEAALDALLAQRARRKGIVTRPRPSSHPGAATGGGAAGNHRTASGGGTTGCRGATKGNGMEDGTGTACGSRSASGNAVTGGSGRAREAVPAAVKREVWVRSGGACEWPLDSGGRCGSTLRLELDHVIPLALGGPSTIDNLRVACRFHNQLAARRAFGDRVADRYTREGRAVR